MTHVVTTLNSKEMELRETKVPWNDVQDLLELSPENIEYLQKAFNQIEKLWYEQFKEINPIKYVMLAEAPLYGENKSYFYNRKAKFTSFLYFDDLRVISEPKAEKSKEEAFRIMKEHGLIILDLFPFALNKKTSITYKSMGKKKYRNLFQTIISHYLKPKLQLIEAKSDQKIRFFYRYKRVKDWLGDIFKQELFNAFKIHTDLEVISKNCVIDRKKFKEVLKL